jgi:hypothetical protein
MKDTSVNTSAAHGGIVGFAGSRHGSVPEAKVLVSVLASQGVSFLVGCAPGVDQSFRQALLPFASRTTVHCAFSARAGQIAQSELTAVCRVGTTPSAAAALHRRTVGMVADCTYLVLFPDDPRTGTWGRGSSLAFRTAMQQNKRVFVVTAIPPLATRHARVIPASLFGVVSGYLVVPANAEATHAA